MAIEQRTDRERSDQASGGKATLRVKVVDSRDGRTLSNVTLPIGMVKWGLKMAARFAPEMKEADVDWDAIAEMIDGGAQGEIVHVEDEEKHRTVTVSVQ